MSVFGNMFRFCVSWKIGIQTNAAENNSVETKYISSNPQSIKKSFGDMHHSLLDKQIYYILPAIFVVYIILQTLMGINRYYSHQPICNEHIELADWVKTCLSSAAACMILTFIMQLIRIAGLMQAKKRNSLLIKMLVELACVSCISGSSLFLSFQWEYGGICLDSLGVYTNAAQWSEWIVLVPFLQYTALSAEQKEYLETFDIAMIVILFFIILSGFLLTLKFSYGVSLFLFLSAALGLFYVTYLIFVNYFSVMKHSKKNQIRTMNFFKERQKIRKATLLNSLISILWYYPIVYVLSMAKVFDYNYTIAFYALGSMFGKILFSTMVIETHISLLYEFLLTNPNTHTNNNAHTNSTTTPTTNPNSMTNNQSEVQILQLQPVSTHNSYPENSNYSSNSNNSSNSMQSKTTASREYEATSSNATNEISNTINTNNQYLHNNNHNDNNNHNTLPPIKRSFKTFTNKISANDNIRTTSALTLSAIKSLNEDHIITNQEEKIQSNNDKMIKKYEIV